MLERESCHPEFDTKKLSIITDSKDDSEQRRRLLQNSSGQEEKSYQRGRYALATEVIKVCHFYIYTVVFELLRFINPVFLILYCSLQFDKFM